MYYQRFSKHLSIHLIIFRGSPFTILEAYIAASAPRSSPPVAEGALQDLAEPPGAGGWQEETQSPHSIRVSVPKTHKFGSAYFPRIWGRDLNGASRTSRYALENTFKCACLSVLSLAVSRPDRLKRWTYNSCNIGDLENPARPGRTLLIHWRSSRASCRSDRQPQGSFGMPAHS